MEIAKDQEIEEGGRYLSNTAISQHHKFVYCHFARHGDPLKLQVRTNSLNVPETRYQKFESF